MILWLQAARRDVAQIYSYIAEHDETAARKMAVRIFAAPDRLRDFPRSGIERPDIAEGLRSLLAGRYILLYRVVGEDVEIVRVLHSSRDLAATLTLDL